MNYKFIYCPNCGAKNSIDSLYCQNCGTSLSKFIGKQSQTIFSNKKTTNQANSNTLNGSSQNVIFIIIGAIIVIGMISLGYKYYINHQNQEICQIIHRRFSKEDFKIRINRDDKTININPSSTQGEIIFTDDADELKEYNDDVSDISQNVMDTVGKGWTINVANPFNKHRYLWIIKDGKFKYSIYQVLIDDEDVEDYEEYENDY